MEDLLKDQTKLMRQYIEFQLKYPSYIVMMELGSFYEIWELEDLKIGHAIKASQIMNVTLTRRSKSNPDSPRMAGVPSHTVENYIKKLVDAGETVVVVSQEKKGKKADNNKNLERYIEKIVSPGTIVDKIGKDQPNYFGACFIENNFVGISLIDLSTGEVRLTELKKEDAISYIEQNKPVELLFCSPTQDIFEQKKHQLWHFLDKQSISKPQLAGNLFSKIYEIDNPSSNQEVVLSKLGIEYWPLATLSLANLLNFLVEYNPLLLKKISHPKAEIFNDHVFLSKNTFLSLELLTSATDPDSDETLFGVLAKCKTAMGRRKLYGWISRPLTDLEKINKRLDKVEKYIKDENFLIDLKNVYDLSRLVRKIAVQQLMPHEIAFLFNSLKICNNLVPNESAQKAISYIEKNINIPIVETKSNEYSFFIGDHFSNIKEFYHDWQNKMEKADKLFKRLCKTLQTDRLKISETKEFFQISGPKGLAKICDDNGITYKRRASDLQIIDNDWEEAAQATFILKQKFLSEASKEWENFQKSFINNFGEELLGYSEEIGEEDCLSTFASLSKERFYNRPQFIESDHASVDFKNMRHPVLEQAHKVNESFIPNDVKLDQENNILVIYGVNSGGKSTVLKSVALNIIMAQIGCFVPCEKATLTVFNNIMTRMTTYDQIHEGLSTFTMEMVELQSALKKVEDKSLFLFDEIGRGTSSEDGEAIAFAVLDYLSSQPSNNAITMFATHYHPLYPKLQKYKNIDVKHISCDINEKEDIIFSRKLLDGPGSGSYGIIVAKSCGIPNEIIRLAQNYSKEYHKAKVSRYNSKVMGTVCELCNKNPATETHHIIEQHQGKIQYFTINGVVKNIHDEGNLVLICPNCHDDITKNKISIEKRKTTGYEGFFLEIKRND